MPDDRKRHSLISRSITSIGAVVAVERVMRRFYELQYHPESTRNKAVFSSFAASRFDVIVLTMEDDDVMDEEHQWTLYWNVAKCVAAAIKSSNSKLRRNKKKVIDSNLNENGLDGDDTNNIKSGNAQTAGSSSCNSDVDFDGGACTSAWKTRTDKASRDKEVNQVARDSDDALVRLADDKTLDIAGVGNVILKTSFGTSWTLKDVRWFGEAKESFLYNVSENKETIESKEHGDSCRGFEYVLDIFSSYSLLNLPHTLHSDRVAYSRGGMTREGYKSHTLEGNGSEEVRYSFWDTKSHQVIRSRDITFVDSIYGARSTKNSSSLTNLIQKSQVVLVDIPKNLAENDSIVAEHRLSQKSLRAQVGAQIRVRGPKTVGASRIVEDEMKNTLKTKHPPRREAPRLHRLPAGKKASQSLWMFRVKEEQDGMKRYKDRLVVKSFQQIHRVDYIKIFSLVVKMTTLELVLSIVAFEDLHLEQFDVKTAFLHGDLDKDIYMTQPEGFQSTGKKKTLYSWNEEPCSDVHQVGDEIEVEVMLRFNWPPIELITEDGFLLERACSVAQPQDNPDSMIAQVEQITPFR
ncbi:retrovirus-related pol polyprotein from transposon TNT 1-94 [Tanacetum coccineum]